jgi:hypothetical protein
VTESLFDLPDPGDETMVSLQVTELAQRVSALEKLLLGEPERAGYTPQPSPRFWLLEGDERLAAIGRLKSWTSTVYVPGYGYLAAKLLPCWTQHNLCLTVLDWLSEMHAVLYIRATRPAKVLDKQAEYTLRFLPAAVELMAAELSGCQHGHMGVTP